MSARYLFIGDVHFGISNCASLLTKFIRNNIDGKTRIVWVGDLVEISSIYSPSDPWKTIPSEISDMAEIISLFSKHTIGIISGNHEYRMRKGFGVCASEMLARISGVPYLGLEHTIHTQNYSIYTTHGSGGGRLPSVPVNNLYHIASYANADAIVIGHHHVPCVVGMYCTYTGKPVWGACVPSWVERPDYSVMKALPPRPSYGGVIIEATKTKIFPPKLIFA